MKKSATINKSVIGRSVEAARAATGKVKAFIKSEDVKASAINGNNNPTGQQRLMHAIMSTKEAYHKTTNGKRTPKMPTKKQRMKIINHMIRMNAQDKNAIEVK